MVIVSTFARNTQEIESPRGAEMEISTESELRNFNLRSAFPNPKQEQTTVCCPRIPECCRRL